MPDEINKQSQLSMATQKRLSSENKVLLEDIENINAELKAAIEIRQIPEIVFKDVYLENFKNIARGGPVDNSITMSWISHAGGPYAEVDIIDNEGNTLFRVPSIIARPSVDSTKLKSISFSGVTAKYQAESNRLQQIADNYLGGVLNGLEKAVKKDSEEIALRWSNIFKHYENQDKNNNDEETSQSNVEENTEYDFGS